MRESWNKLLRFGLLMLAMTIVLTAFTSVNAEAAAKIKLNKKKAMLMLVADPKVQLELTGAKRKITWKTSDKSVATVSKTGMVTAVAEGKATITAKCNGKK